MASNAMTTGLTVSGDPRIDIESAGDGDTGDDPGFETDLDPAAFKQAHFRTLNVPNSVVAGQQFSVSGLIHWDFWGVNNIECRAVADPSWGSVRRQNVGKLDHCESKAFEIPLIAPDMPGQTVTVAMKSQNNPPLSSWETNQTETFQIDVVSQTEKTTRAAVGFVPWVAAGGVTGFGVARATDLPTAQATVAGVGAGAVMKLTTDQIRQANLDFSVQFPLVEVVAFAALLGSGALLLNEATGVFEEGAL